MNVLISSTIFPQANEPGLVRSVYSPDERLLQTKQSVEALINLGYANIILCDNSGSRYQAQLENEFPQITVRAFDHFQFDNKGISECYLLLQGISCIDNDEPVIKLSGRYKMNQRLDVDLSDHDIAAKISRHSDRIGAFQSTMVTRCYVARNKTVLYAFLTETLEQIYAYPSRVYGLGSLLRLLRNQFGWRNDFSYLHSNLSVEAAGMLAIRQLRLRLKELDTLHLQGLAATFDDHSIVD